MIRRFVALALSTALVVTFLAAPGPAAAQTVRSMAATGDSITRAFNLCFFPFTDCPAQSWSTGTNTTVNSHARRLNVLSTAYNDAVSGAKMADLPGQMTTVAGRNVDYVTVLMGGNDVCTDTEAGMTSPASYEASFRTAMDKLATDMSPPLVYVVSVPNVKVLWEILKDNSTARSRWSSYNICQSLLANPLSTAPADVDRRERVKQRNMELNQRLRAACALYAFCRFDGERVFGTPFVPNDVSTRDYFHPSTAGQAKLAETSFTYGPYTTSVVNDAPTADFTWTCAGLTCSFTDKSTDASHAIAGWSWNFDSVSSAGPTSTAQFPMHTFPAAGTYQVKLHAIDAFGATNSLTRAVSVSDAGSSNSPPTAEFTWNCADLSCSFDGTGSSDSDGTIASYSWDFGDGASGSGSTVSHVYAVSGTYTVTLTVTDNEGATGSTSTSVTASAPASGITLSVAGTKVKGTKTADLSWSNATSSNVDIYRDGAFLTSTANNGAHTDSIGKGGGTHTYQVCESGTSTCSPEVSVSY